MHHLKYILAAVLSLVQWSSCALNKHTGISASDQSLLWKVTSKEGTRTSYLFGTLHVICEQDYFFTPEMKKAFDSCEDLFLEVDMNDVGDIMDMQEKMLLKDGRKLSDYFTEKDYETLSQYIEEKEGLHMTMVNHMAPVAVYMLMMKNAVPCDKNLSYEVELTKMAKESGKKIGGLETAASQLDAFQEALSEEEICREIMQTIHNPSMQTEAWEDMLAAYKNQDLLKLGTQLNDSEFSGHKREVLLDDRNKNWISLIQEQSREKSTFYAVGAGHLIGDHGIIQLLRNKGYQVEAVR